MPILIICPGCKKRFQVSDKFAGKQGPCPQCKTIISIPKKEEEVIIHAPEESGPKTATGQTVLKPISRTEAKWNPMLAAVVAISVVFVVVMAFILRLSISEKENFPVFILALGALMLAPPLVAGGYSFLRDDELAPYQGREFFLRIAACSLVFALSWFAPHLISYALNLDGPFELPHYAMVVPAMVGIGALASLASLDLPFTVAAFHYAFYLGAGVLLRLIMGLAPF